MRVFPYLRTWYSLKPGLSSAASSAWMAYRVHIVCLRLDAGKRLYWNWRAGRVIAFHSRTATHPRKEDLGEDHWIAARKADTANQHRVYDSHAPAEGR